MKNYEATERAFKNGYEKGYEDGKRDARAEERHGHWIIHKAGRHAAWAECSECLVCGSSKWKRCPVCEAKMDMPNITAEANDALNKIGKAVHGGNDG